MFEHYYDEHFQDIFGTPLSPGDGLGREAVQLAMDRVGGDIPTALSDYYALAGRHWINDNHNCLRPIERLEWDDDKLVFLVENQGVVLWAVDRANLADADPIVWQGVVGKPIEWHAEELRLSQFLIDMWRWTMMDEDESAGA